MSVVIIENLKLNESIYDVIKKDQPPCVKSPRYQSIHSVRVRCERKKAQDGHSTMGYAKYPLRSPCEFLKKRSGIVWVRKEVTCERLPKPKRKPPLPNAAVRRGNKKTDSKAAQNIPQDSDVYVKICQCCNNNVGNCFCCPEPCGPDECKEVEKSESIPSNPVKRQTCIPNTDLKTKNIIVRNILNVVHAKPKTPVLKYVDTNMGTRKEVIPSGIVPYYILQKNFGKTPEYILKFIEEKEEAKRRQHDEELLKRRPACRYVTQDERDKLLLGLKKNWEEMQSRYQGLPILTDTIPKKIRKTQMEAQLLELEKDIRLIEQHPYIYVYAD